MISIFGGSGFIGNKLSEMLTKDSLTFEILDKTSNPKFKEITKFCDVSDLSSIENSFNGDVIINLAAVHRDDIKPKSLYEQVNVDGARNICNIAEHRNISRIIFVSSVAVYGFAKPNADENTLPNPFNEYGKTKLEAEKVFKDWFDEDPQNRSLTIIRPTVVFGEKNRGNVYNLLYQLNKSFFPMIGSGENIKSIAYVDNVASFIKYSLKFSNGLHIYNYVDKPDLKLIDFIKLSRRYLRKNPRPSISINYKLALLLGYALDLISFLTKRSFPLSSIRVKKFCSFSKFASSIDETGFKAPFSIQEGIKKTIKYEFLEDNSGQEIFESE